MPSYNHARFLPAAIESVLAQDVPGLELIVVDDASQDASPRLAQEWAARVPAVRAVLHERNLGIARTFNDGLALARGEFTALLASDDLWLPGKLERQLAVLAERPEHVVCSEGLVIDADGRATGQTFSQLFGAEGRRRSGRVLEEFLQGYCLFFSSLVMRTQPLRELGFDERLRYANDFKLALELARRFEFTYLDEPLACHRRHGANATLMHDRAGWGSDGPLLREYLLAEFGELLQRRPDLAKKMLGMTQVLTLMGRAARRGPRG